MAFEFRPLSPATWDSFVDLFGDKGACGGCWCMVWRLKAADFKKQTNESNKRSIHQLVKKNIPIGILAFSGKEAVGWCAVAPREEYVRLESSRVLKPVDTQQVWSVSCFFIRKGYRRKGLSVRLLKEAVRFAVSNGARIVEGYPISPKDDKMPDVFAWTGFDATFVKAGFEEVERRSEARPIMRYYKK